MSYYTNPTIHHILGLAVGFGFVGLGLGTTIKAPYFARVLGTHSAKLDRSDPTIQMTTLVGGRDVSIGLAICWMLTEGHERSAGMLILAGFPLWLCDLASIYRDGQHSSVASWTAFMLGFMGIGYSLL